MDDRIERCKECSSERCEYCRYENVKAIDRICEYINLILKNKE